MGMCFGLNTLSDANIQKISKEPALIWRVIAPDDPDIYLEEKKNNSAGFLSKLFGKKSKPDEIEVPNLHLEDGEGLNTDLDKSWHGLHYLFTQTEWEGDPPLNFIICGGNPVGNIEVGYGPARVMNSKEVEEIDDALNKINHEYLKSKFDPADMMKKQIYPEIWDRDTEDDDALGYCLEYFDVLKRFISEARKNKMGLAIYMS
jgi:hypothetical protein